MGLTIETICPGTNFDWTSIRTCTRIYCRNLLRHSRVIGVQTIKKHVSACMLFCPSVSLSLAFHVLQSSKCIVKCRGTSATIMPQLLLLEIGMRGIKIATAFKIKVLGNCYQMLDFNRAICDDAIPYCWSINACGIGLSIECMEICAK